jgi:hypothetical protein
MLAPRLMVAAARTLPLTYSLATLDARCGESGTSLTESAIPFHICSRDRREEPKKNPANRRGFLSNI